MLAVSYQTDTLVVGPLFYQLVQCRSLPMPITVYVFVFKFGLVLKLFLIRFFSSNTFIIACTKWGIKIMKYICILDFIIIFVSVGATPLNKVQLNTNFSILSQAALGWDALADCSAFSCQQGELSLVLLRWEPVRVRRGSQKGFTLHSMAVSGTKSASVRRCFELVWIALFCCLLFGLRFHHGV